MATEIDMEMIFMFGIGFRAEHGGEQSAGRAMRLPQQLSFRRGCGHPIRLHSDGSPIGKCEPHNIERIGEAVFGDKTFIAAIAIAAHHRGAGIEHIQTRIERRIGIGIHVSNPIGQCPRHGAIGGHRARQGDLMTVHIDRCNRKRRALAANPLGNRRQHFANHAAGEQHRTGSLIDAIRFRLSLSGLIINLRQRFRLIHYLSIVRAWPWQRRLLRYFLGRTFHGRRGRNRSRCRMGLAAWWHQLLDKILNWLENILRGQWLDGGEKGEEGKALCAHDGFNAFLPQHVAQKPR